MLLPPLLAAPTIFIPFGLGADQCHPSGERDEQLAQAGKQGSARKKKKAA
jgi:hypothetical protein